jgi:hypothetical protein
MTLSQKCVGAFTGNCPDGELSIFRFSFVLKLQACLCEEQAVARDESGRWLC